VESMRAFAAAVTTLAGAAAADDDVPACDDAQPCASRAAARSAGRKRGMGGAVYGGRTGESIGRICRTASSTVNVAAFTRGGKSSTVA